MSEAAIKPVPLPDDTTRPFWDAANQRQLVVQRCSACRYYNHPPRTVCDTCLSRELNFETVSGRGHVYSFTVMHLRDVPGFEQEAPFITIVVELEEQPMLLMVSNLPVAERDRVWIGAPVTVEFEDRGNGTFLPQFKIA